MEKLSLINTLEIWKTSLENLFSGSMNGNMENLKHFFIKIKQRPHTGCRWINFNEPLMSLHNEIKHISLYDDELQEHLRSSEIIKKLNDFPEKTEKCCL